MHYKRIAAPMLIVALISCAPLQEQGKHDQDQARDNMRSKLASKETVVAHNQAYGGVEQLSAAEQLKAQNAWLRSIRVTLDIDEPISAVELVRMLKKKGVNITSATDLDNHVYSGFGVKDVDAETALNILFGAMGLDFTVNAEGKYVTITPVASKTFYLNLGNRQTYFGGGTEGGGTSSGQMGGSGTSGLQTGQGSQGSQSSGLGQSSGAYGGQQQGQGTTGNTSSGTGSNMSGTSHGNSIIASDQFWRSLGIEIGQRLTVLVPNRKAMASMVSVQPVMPNATEQPSELANINLPKPGATPVVNADASGKSALYDTQTMGNYSINPETGAVTIRAPRWLLDSFTEYFHRIEEQYNTVVEFTGEIVHLTTDAETLEGLDVAAFASFAHGQYGAVVTNNTLGGVNVALPSTTQALAATAGNAFASAMPMVGIVSAANKLQVFNAYLSNIGHIDIVQKPVLATSSGIPGEFKKTERHYYNKPGQTAASGGVGSATTATQNEWIPIDTGIDLRIYPRYDTASGLVRAQISLNQDIQTGTQPLTQYLTQGNSTQQVTTDLPVISNQKYSGEALLRDGDLIIVGGQIEDDSNTGHSGITGLMDIEYMSGIFGRKDTKKHFSTYYFALHVHVRKHNA